jgi:hypothetical protein
MMSCWRSCLAPSRQSREPAEIHEGQILSSLEAALTANSSPQATGPSIALNLRSSPGAATRTPDVQGLTEPPSLPALQRRGRSGDGYLPVPSFDLGIAVTKTASIASTYPC